MSFSSMFLCAVFASCSATFSVGTSMKRGGASRSAPLLLNSSQNTPHALPMRTFPKVPGARGAFDEGRVQAKNFVWHMPARFFLVACDQQGIAGEAAGKAAISLQAQVLHDLSQLLAPILTANKEGLHLTHSYRAPLHDACVFGKNDTIFFLGYLDQVGIVYGIDEQGIVTQRPQPDRKFSNVVIDNEFGNHKCRQPFDLHSILVHIPSTRAGERHEKNYSHLFGRFYKRLADRIRLQQQRQSSPAGAEAERAEAQHR